MPLTEFQREVLAVLARNRSEASHFAGGLVWHAGDESVRYSHDFDIFHEASEEVVRASDRDVVSLRDAGYEVVTLSRYGEWEKSAVDFRKARVLGGGDSVEVDWAADSAFRFFPIERDERLGWRLHPFDSAINKALTLTARTETRDYVDIITMGRVYPLAALCWAAPGKDPGFSPGLVLTMMRRFARLDPANLTKMQARELDPIALKLAWIEMSDAADALITQLADAQPDLPIGVAFVDATGRPGWLGDDPTLRIHHPSLRGCWPTVRSLEP